MPNSYPTFEKQDIRRIIVTELAKENTFSMQDRALLNVLSFNGYPKKSLDYLRTQLAWLQDEAGVVSVQIYGDRRVVLLNKTGLDVAEGRQNVPGIASLDPID